MMDSSIVRFRFLFRRQGRIQDRDADAEPNYFFAAGVSASYST